MSILRLFCHVDSFCQWLATWEQAKLLSVTRKRGPAPRLSLSEVLTIRWYKHRGQVTRALVPFNGSTVIALKGFGAIRHPFFGGQVNTEKTTFSGLSIFTHYLRHPHNPMVTCTLLRGRVLVLVRVLLEYLSLHLGQKERRQHQAYL